MDKKHLNWRQLKGLAYAVKNPSIYPGSVKWVGLSTLGYLRAKGYLELRNKQTDEYVATDAGRNYMGWPQTEVDRLYPPQLDTMELSK